SRNLVELLSVLEWVILSLRDDRLARRGIVDRAEERRQQELRCGVDVDLQLFVREHRHGGSERRPLVAREGAEASPELKLVEVEHSPVARLVGRIELLVVLPFRAALPGHFVVWIEPIEKREEHVDVEADRGEHTLK